MTAPDLPVARASYRSMVVRVASSVGLLGVLWWTVPDLDPSALVPRWNAASLLWLAGALIATLSSFVLAAVRWREVLRAIGCDQPLSRLLGLVLAGQFVSNALPSTVGGDVLRVRRLARDIGSSLDAMASVVLERLVGWLVLPALTFLGLGLNGGLRRLGSPAAIALGVAVVTIAGLGAFLGILADRRTARRLAGRTGWRRVASAVAEVLGGLRDHPTAGPNVVAIGAVYSITLVLAAWMAARVIGIDQVGPTAVLAFYPAVLVLQALPIGIAGFGIREGALVLFLTPLGVPAEQAMALGVLLYLLTAVASLLGAPAFAMGGRRAAVPVDDEGAGEVAR